MARIRDVWINWFEGEENGYNVCPFHEWHSEDQIEVLDQAEIVKVTEKLFDYIENRMEDVPEELLSEVFQKSTLRKNMTRVTLDYCFIMFDGERAMAIDTLGYKTPIRKSRLTPKHERLVNEIMDETKEEKCFDVEEQVPPKEYHILSPHPQYMAGLTRKERQLKQLLFMALDQLYTSGETAEVRYWYTEWNPAGYEEMQHIDKESAWQRLYQEVKHDWSDAHYELCKKMIKGQPFFEKIWNLHHEEEVK
ncbi:Protein of unknown function [Alteribacillus persepolensis]|uniref:Uncharacterized protein n=1 Tax=Alteribacillus persepolensis TaxID=568899 RepID=A0A1G8H1D6_9BACI|nr:DUF3603 family protein [Alteribacillus persepolensis]SDI00416.1 Protein of unknown function [Alteribacillus persepolensis]